MKQKSKDFSGLTEEEKDHALSLLLENKPEEAKNYLQTTMAGVREQQAEQTKDILRQTPDEQDLSLELIQQFLQHAPEEAKEFFMSDYMSEEEKRKAMSTFRYAPTTIEILDPATGKIVETMEKEDYTVPDEQLELGRIEKDGGVTYFSFAAIEDDDLVPSMRDWETLLRLMPARDYSRFSWSRAGRQLYALLGGKLSGVRSDGTNDDFGDYGYFWSRSPRDAYRACALGSGNSRGELNDSDKSYLLPVRRRVRTV